MRHLDAKEEEVMMECTAVASALCTVAGCAMGANHVRNGSVEVPAVQGSNDDGRHLYWYERVPAGWAVPWSHNAGAALLKSRPGGWQAHSGSQFVEIESGYSGRFSQAIQTQPGVYRLRFAYAANPDAIGPDDSLRVRWNGTEVTFLDLESSTVASLEWQLFRYDVVATGENSILEFEDGYDGVPYAGAYLDSISLVSASCLCAVDFNCDGMLDFFDYLDFVANFDAEDLSADFNGDEFVDFFDYLDFVGAFDAGCE
jgi:hypothetical protein